MLPNEDERSGDVPRASVEEADDDIVTFHNALPICALRCQRQGRVEILDVKDKSKLRDQRC